MEFEMTRLVDFEIRGGPAEFQTPSPPLELQNLSNESFLISTRPP